MVTLLSYGVIQERIMTQPYGENQERFKNAAYLVLNNRVVAIFIAIGMMFHYKEKMKNAAPIQNFFGVSVSNTFATLCQYEALRYVSFPTQTLGKCGKMIPVMIIGAFISGKTYGLKDFGIAGAVTAGCVMFVLTGDVSSSSEEADSAYGLILMGAYLFSDAFTSTFQDKLFKGYEMSTYNQTLYVNLCSALISVVTLIYQGEFTTGFYFSLAHPDFFFNTLILSASAALGQLAIYYTIKAYGALFFATVMTLRQVISIILSCVIYRNPLSWGQILSAALVFTVLYYKDTVMRSGHSHRAPPAEELPRRNPHAPPSGEGENRIDIKG